MLPAGAGARFSLGRRSDREYLVERSVRLALPVLVGTFLLMPPQIWAERVHQGRYSGSLWSFLPRFVDGFYPEGNLSAGHLWFLAYLYVYAVVTLPLLRRLRGPAGTHGIRRLTGRLSTRWRLVLLAAIPIAVTQIALREPFPETLALVDDWANHGLMLLAYLYGFLLMGDPGLEERIQRDWPAALFLAVVGSVWISWSVWTSTEPDFLGRGRRVPLLRTAPDGHCAGGVRRRAVGRGRRGQVRGHRDRVAADDAGPRGSGPALAPGAEAVRAPPWDGGCSRLSLG